VPRDEIAFADARGMTLYVYAKDPIGKSTCVDACAKNWLPLLAPKSAKVLSNFSVIVRDDGAKQWAHNGHALYTYIKDVDPGSVNGNSPARFGSRRKNGAGEYVGGGFRGAGARGAAKDVPLPEDWKVAFAWPVPEFPMPAGLGIKEVPEAAAFALVDYRARTLYAFDGDPVKDAKACTAPCAFQPARAAQLAEPMGDFAVIVRKDGIKQWTYKGKGLYTFDGDLAPADVNGLDVNKHWGVAAVHNFYMPANVVLQKTLSQGRVLATATGRTLYRRDGYIFQSGGGHSLRRGQPPRPAVGRDIGVAARCVSECDKWHALLAPKDAEPQGFWSVLARPDGAKQWAYQGYALWTYDGDTRAGDIKGNDSYDYAFGGQPGGVTEAALDVGTPQDGVPALYWAIAVP
jgi:predicted lipoprotein with Yx(FWY)xxD motif